MNQSKDRWREGESRGNVSKRWCRQRYITYDSRRPVLKLAIRTNGRGYMFLGSFIHDTTRLIISLDQSWMEYKKTYQWSARGASIRIHKHLKEGYCKQEMNRWIQSRYVPLLASYPSCRRTCRWQKLYEALRKAFNNENVSLTCENVCARSTYIVPYS